MSVTLGHKIRGATSVVLVGFFEPPVCGGISLVKGNHSNVVVSVVVMENNRILVLSVLK